MVANRFEDLDEAIKYGLNHNYTDIGYHQYSVKGGYYFAYDRTKNHIDDNEYPYLTLKPE